MIPISEIEKVIWELESKKNEARSQQIGFGGRADYRYLGREEGFNESIIRLKELIPTEYQNDHSRIQGTAEQA